MASSLPTVQDEIVLQRLKWIKFPLEGRSINLATSTATSRPDLYWPALHYSSHKEAADFGNHQNFQQMLAEPLLEILLNEQPDPGPVCRLLGFQDGTYMNASTPSTVDDDDGATPSSSESDVKDFYRHMARLFVPLSHKNTYFDASLPEEQALWDLYQAACLEAKALVSAENRKKRRLVPPTSNIASNNISSNSNKRSKATIDHENNGGGSNSSSNGGNDDDDKPDAAARVTFQGVSPPNNHNARPVLAQVNNKNEVTQGAAGTNNSKGPAASPPNKDKKSNKKEKEAPGTPPFHAKSALLKVSPDEPWSKIWWQMRCNGWVRRRGPNEAGDLVWVKPGRSPLDGVPGVDYFTTEEAVQAYVQSKISQWRPPAWRRAAQQQQPAAANANANIHQRRAANNMSSSATVITTDSSPGAKPAAPARAFRRRAAASHVGASSKYTTQSSLVAYKVKEQLWWRTQGVPTLTQVKPILHALGIRRNESGSYVLPDAVGDDDDENSNNNACCAPDLTDADTLRKFLCTKGVPRVPGTTDLLTNDEKNLLHQWVSFAYVPTDDLEEDLTSMTLPPQKKILYLLSKFKFQMTDEKYFLPLVDQSGARGDARVEGLHFFHGLDRVRDYIRRTASFSWTQDEFEESENDIVAYEQDKALLRLWAASSPSPLSTYETSLSCIQKMETMLPRADNEFETDSEAEESEVEEDDSSDEESVEEEESVEGSSESEQESVESSSSPTDSGEMSDSQSQDSPEPTKQPTVAAKRKGDNAKPVKKRPTKKQKSLPWWQKQSFPSLDTMQPIISKLGIFKKSGVYVLPGKGKIADLKNPESLRKHLCSHGIPVHDTIKPKLSDHEKELLRRWVSFAYVPVTLQDCVEELTNVLPQYEKLFAAGAENKIAPILYSVGFQKEADGNGYFPPGIDSLGRDKETRKANLKSDLSKIREYIRCSERLVLDAKTQPVREDSELRIDSVRLLALRLWAALEPSTLLSYKVDASEADYAAAAATADTRTVPAKTQKRKAKPHVQEPEPLDCPAWWTEVSLDQIQDKIEELEAKDRDTKNKMAGARVPRRGHQAPHMNTQQLELACRLRMRIESIVRSSQMSKTSKTIDDVAADICGDCGCVSVFTLQNFLCGDKRHMVRQEVHEEAEGVLEQWVDDQEGVTKLSKSKAACRNPDRDATSDFSTPSPTVESNAAERRNSIEIPSDSEQTADSSGRRGSLVSNVVDMSQSQEPQPFLSSFGAAMNNLSTEGSNIEEESACENTRADTSIEENGKTGDEAKQPANNFFVEESCEAETTSRGVDDTNKYDSGSPVIDSNYGEAFKEAAPAFEIVVSTGDDSANKKVNESVTEASAAVLTVANQDQGATEKDASNSLDLTHDSAPAAEDEESLKAVDASGDHEGDAGADAEENWKDQSFHSSSFSVGCDQDHFNDLLSPLESLTGEENGEEDPPGQQDSRRETTDFFPITQPEGNEHEYDSDESGE